MSCESNSPNLNISTLSPSAMRRLPGNVLLFNLMERQTVTALTVSDSAFDQMVLTNGIFETLGPAIQDIVMHVEVRNISGQFGLRIGIQRKYLDGDWDPIPASFTNSEYLVGSTNTEVGANGYNAYAPYSDRSRLGALRIRLMLQYHAKSTGGGAIGAKAELSISAACRLFNS